MFVKKIMICLLSVLAVSGLYASSWGDLEEKGVLESASTSYAHPSRLGQDSDSGTYWQLSDGESDGWFISYTESDTRYKRITVTADIPDGVRLSVSYYADNSWILLPGCVWDGPFDGSSVAGLPEGVNGSDRLLVHISGTAAYKAKVYEINLEKSDSPAPFQKIVPESYTVNFTECINAKAARLWDGIKDNQWYEPSSQHTSFFKRGTGFSGKKLFVEEQSDYPSYPQIVWNLDSTYEITRIKLYQTAWNKKITVEYYDNDTESWRPCAGIGNRWSTGWISTDVDPVVKTAKLRFTFKDGWWNSSGIGEIEVWGAGEGTSRVRKILLDRDNGSSVYHAMIDDLADDEYWCSVQVHGTTGKLSGTWNNESVQFEKTGVVNGNTLYRAGVSASEDFNGINYIEITSPDEVLSCELKVSGSDGKMDLGLPWSNGYYDQTSLVHDYSIPAAHTWVFPEDYEIERIRVYSDFPGMPKFYLGDRRHTQVLFSYLGNGCWEAQPDGVSIQRLSYVCDKNETVNQVEVWGSGIRGNVPGWELWKPEISPGSCLLGWLNKPSSVLSVNSFRVNSNGSLFWIDASGLSDSLSSGNTMVITCDGEVSRRRYCGALPGSILTLSNDDSFVMTGQGTYTVSGTVQSGNLRVFVNGIEVSVENQAFSTQLSLDYGFQNITVTACTGRQQFVVYTFEQTIYRYTDNLKLELGTVYGSCYTQKNGLLLSGRVGNGYGYQVTVNGKNAVLNGEKFSIDTDLSEGVQVIPIVVKDAFGRTAEKDISVMKDHTSPVFTIISPGEGTYLSNSTVPFTMMSAADTELWWKTGSQDWLYGGENPCTIVNTFSDGLYRTDVTAQDRCGNISETEYVDYVVDTAAPEEFKIEADVSGWTNDTQPVLTFSAADATSGVKQYYEVLDDGAETAVTSPLRLAPLSDGEHVVKIIAEDYALNRRVESISLYIDTSSPPVPVDFEVIPGDGFLTVHWTGVNDGEEYQTYKVERSAAWETTPKAVNDHYYGALSYTDENLEQAAEYKYRVWAVDRAGNESEKTAWTSAVVGVGKTTVVDGKSTVVKFDRMVVSVPSGALAGDVVQLLSGEVPVSYLELTPYHPLVSSVYRIEPERKSDGTTYVTAHADLSENAVISISYAEDAVPDGYTAENIVPFYYDDVWDRWMQVNDFVVDTADRIVLMKVNHFSDFSLQATDGRETIEDQLRESYTAGSGKTGHGDVIVETSGGMSTSFTELTLPGINSLDLVLRREYSTWQAAADALRTNSDGTTLSDSRQKKTDPDCDGSYPWYLGRGWKLDFPYLQWTAGSVVVKDLSGSVASTAQMIQKHSRLAGDSICEVVYENHENNDYTLILTLNRTAVKATFLFWELNKITGYTYSIKSAQLIMNDGRSAFFDAKGRVTEICDANGTNKITFSYSDNKVQSITDTRGRVISFTYDGRKIKSITSQNESSSVTYSYTSDTLLSATDLGGRHWNYSYSDQIRSDVSTVKKTDTKTYYSVPYLQSISGPGIGLQTLTYTQITKKYSDTYVSDFVETDASFVENSYIVSSKTESTQSTGSPEKTVKYTFDIAKKTGVSGSDSYFTQSMTADDGKIAKKTTYTGLIKTRKRLSLSEEAVYKAVSEAVGGDIGTWKSNSAVLSVNPYVVTTDNYGTRLETQTQTWDAGLLRVLRNKIERSQSDYYSEVMKYDDWGNVIEKTTTGAAGGSITEKTEYALYYGSFDDYAAASIPPDLSSAASVIKDYVIRTSSGTDAGSTTWTDYEKHPHNLPAGSHVVSGGDTASFGSSPDRWVFYAYDLRVQNGTGLRTKEMVYIGTGAIDSSYTVDSIGGSDWSVTAYTYDTKNRITTVTNPLSEVVQYSYDDSAESGGTQAYIVKKTEAGPDSVFTSYYDSDRGTVIKEINPDGNTSFTSYDQLNRPVSVTKIGIAGSSGEKKLTTGYTYSDTFGALAISVTNPGGGVQTYSYDNLGRLVKVSSIGSRTIITEYEYDAYGRVITEKGPYYADAAGDIPEKYYTWDSRDRLLVSGSYIDGNTAVEKSTVYDDTLGTVSTTDEVGRAVVVMKDWFGNSIKTSAGSGAGTRVTKAAYDGFGHLVLYTDPENCVTKGVYTPDGLLADVYQTNLRGDSALTVHFDYNKARRKVETTRSLGGGEKEIVRYRYNQRGQATAVMSTVSGQVLSSGGAPGAAVSDTITITNTYTKSGSPAEKLFSSTLSGETCDEKWVYDGFGRVGSHSISDTVSSDVAVSEQYGYDNLGDIVQVTEPDGSVTSSEYDSQGRIVSATMPSANGISSEPSITVNYTLDASGRLVRRSYAGDTGAEEYTYDRAGRLTSQTTKSGSQNKSYTTAYEYTKAGQVSSVTNPGCEAVLYTYDDLGRVKKEGSDTTGYTRYEYNRNGQITSVTDGNGNKTGYSYNNLRLLEKTTDAAGKSYTYEYDDGGRLTAYTDSNKNTRKFSYDELGRLIAEEMPWGSKSYYRYDAFIDPAVLDAPNDISYYIQSPDKNTRKGDISYGRDVSYSGLQTLSPVKKRVWDPGNKRSVSAERTTVDNRMNTTSDCNKPWDDMYYPAAGNALSSWMESGSRYNVRARYGNVVQAVDGRGTYYSSTYDALGHMLSQTASNGSESRNSTSSYIYDAAGNLKKSTSGSVTTLYNTGTDGTTGTYAANPYGLINERTTVVNGLSMTIKYHYDNKLRVDSMVYPGGETIAYTYDSLNELKTAEGFVGGEMTYNDYGRLSDCAAGSGTGDSFAAAVITRYSYDAAGRVTKAAAGSGSGTGTFASYAYGYDAAGNIVQLNDNVYTYDALNQLTGSRETGLFAKNSAKLNPSYYESSRDYEGQNEIDVSAPVTTTLNLDAACRSVAIDLGQVYWVNKIELHPQNKIHRVDPADIDIYAGDSADGSWTKLSGWTESSDETGAMSLNFAEKFRSRYIKVVTTWDDRDITDTSIEDFATFFNVPSELVRVQVLVTERTEAYEYDAAGNRTKRTVDGETAAVSYYTNESGGNLDLVRYDGTWYYTYDGNGNMTMRGKAASDAGTGNVEIDTSSEYWKYEWDLQNRLESVSENGTVAASYAYDAEGYRVMRTGKTGGTGYYAYTLDGALAYTKTTGTEETERTIAYIGGRTTGWKETSGGESNVRYAVTDHLGSVTKVVSGTGTVLWESGYTPFGQVAGAQGGLSFGGLFTGKGADADTGLYYFNARWYDAEQGRFVSEDPVRDGTNFYAYCGNNPVNYTDPSGLSTQVDENTGTIFSYSNDGDNGVYAYPT